MAAPDFNEILGQKVNPRQRTARHGIALQDVPHTRRIAAGSPLQQ